MDGETPWPLPPAGIVRLFPLPNLVLFPGVIQPLHIFEERYRQMVADALAGDQLLAMAAVPLQAGVDLDGTPPIHPAVCIGQIVAHARLDDGRYNLLLRGVVRARVAQELTKTRLYRQARVQVVPDRWGGTADRAAAAAEELREEFARYCRQPGCLDNELFDNWHDRDLPLPRLIDLIAYALELPSDVKLRILETDDVAQRLEWIRAALRAPTSQSVAAAVGTDRGGFPPAFSEN